MQRKSGSVSTAPPMSRSVLLRLVVDLIAAEQQVLMKSGAISADVGIYRLTLGMTDVDIEAISLDETGLGFDSLALLGLVLRVNRFFQLHVSGAEDYLLIHKSIGAWCDVVTAHMRQTPDGLAFGFETSGSMGAAKTIIRSLDDCLGEVAGLSADPLAHWGSGGRIISLVPPRHMYGFIWTCMLPKVRNIPVVDLHQCIPSSVFREARTGDLIIATPFSWAHTLLADQSFPHGVHGITSAGPADASTFSLCDHAALASMTEIYGSTETGGIGARCAFDSHFRLLPHLKQENAAVYKGAGADTQLLLQDMLNWKTASTFTLEGRHDDVVQIAGVNVSPKHVETAIEQSKHVKKAAVRVSNGRLKAFVVPVLGAPSPTLIEPELRAHIAMSLEATARPVRLRFGSCIPRNAMGKRIDWD